MEAVKPLRVCFVTMGCPKNEADTNRMESLVAQSAYELCETTEDADVAVVNTCSFLTEAVEENLSVIFEIVNDAEFLKRGGKLIVAGCMPSRYGDDLTTSLPEAAGFLPADDEDHILDLIESLTGRSPETDRSLRPSRMVSAPYAYVKISDGCDRFCAFCAIPLIRGHYHSRTIDDIRQEVDTLAIQGVREIILVGQDTGIWGSDLSGTANLSSLLCDLAQSHADMWFRVMYLQPDGITDELLEVMATHENICSYLDIPLQHASRHVLQEMNRSGCAEEFLDVISRIRERMPDVTLRTTVISGFPGETREDSAELVRFLEAAEFDHAGVFMYSREDGTAAALRDDQVPARTKRNRTQKISDLCERIGFQKAASGIGRIEDVLVCGYENDGDRIELVGRTQGQAPDVDGMVHLPLSSARIGDIVSVRLTDSVCYEYEGEVVGRVF